jgi:alpha-mannosidase
MMPFDVPGARAHLDTAGRGLEPGREQLPNSCRDYFTVQNWVDFSNETFGVTIATPENPMVQLGDFNFGKLQDSFHLDRALLLGWVTNTYWDTNFRGAQPGRVWARYVIRPHAGGYDETAAHRFGVEAANPPVYHTATETARPVASLPRRATLLELPAPPVLTLHVLPDENQWHAAGQSAIVIRLLNASEQKQTARIGSGLLKLASVERCDLFGQPMAQLELKNGGASIDIEPRRLAVLRVLAAPLADNL